MSIKAVALWSYTAQEDNEISFVAGDSIDIIELSNQDWFEGFIGEKSGFLPANHVQILTNAPVAPKAPPPPTSLLAQIKKNRKANGAKSPQLESNEEDVGNQGSSDEEDILDGWHTVKTSDDMTYYWNEETGETSWERPQGLKSVAVSKPMSESPVKMASSLSSDSKITDHIESVPAELIRREGAVSYRVKKDFGGLEPSKQHSWHSGWAILCVGYLIVYKTEPTKLKKKLDKIVLPIQVLNLEAVIIKRELKDVGRKNVITIQSRSGAVIVIHPLIETEVAEWFAGISDATREASTPAEYENVLVKLFVKQASLTPKSEKAPAKKKTTEKISNRTETSKKNIVVDVVVEETEDAPSKSTVKNRLNNFFKRGAGDKAEKPKEKEIAPEAIVFGGSLENLAKHSGQSVPLFISKAIQYVESSGGLESQGIYRLSGNASTVQKFRAQLNHENDQDLFEESMDVNVIAALLKLFFREIQVPVIPFTFYASFIETMKIEDYDSRLIEIKNLIQKLPKIHYDVLDYLLRHLVKVAGRSEVNKMEPANIAIVFGPSLIRAEEKGGGDMQAAYADMMNMSFQNALIEAMITQADVFNELILVAI